MDRNLRNSRQIVKNQLNFQKSLMQEMSGFFLWHFIKFQISFEFYFLIFQNQSAAGKVIKLIKQESRRAYDTAVSRVVIHRN